MSRVRIVGHRGAAAVAPENTLASFLIPFQHQVTTIELDVRLTRDGVVVCFHDDRLDRVTALRGPVAEVDWSELQLTNVLSDAFQGAYPRARVPRLADVYAGLPATAQLMVELKADPVRGAELVERTLDIVARAGALERTRIISFDPELLQLARSSSHGRDLSLGVVVGRGEVDQLLPRAAALQAASVHAPYAVVDQSLVNRAHAGGFLVNAWTVNTVDEARRLAALGVDEITTDDPALFVGAGL